MLIFLRYITNRRSPFELPCYNAVCRADAGDYYIAPNRSAFSTGYMPATILMR